MIIAWKELNILNNLRNANTVHNLKLPLPNYWERVLKVLLSHSKQWGQCLACFSDATLKNNLLPLAFPNTLTLCVSSLSGRGREDRNWYLNWHCIISNREAAINSHFYDFIFDLNQRAKKL